MMSSIALLAQPAKLTLVGDWKVQVEYKGKLGVVDISQPSPFTVKNERYDRMADYRAAGGGWTRGTALQGVKAQECTQGNGSSQNPGDQKLGIRPTQSSSKNGKDYQLTPDWGDCGGDSQMSTSPKSTLLCRLIYVKLRIDAIVLTNGATTP